MRILLDARAVGRELSGVGNYILELVKALGSLDEDARFSLCVHGDSRLRDLSLDERFELLDAHFSHESHPLGDLWEELVLPRRVREVGADVLHGPAFLIPFRRLGAATVVTIHDLVAFTHPHTIPRKYALYMRWQIRSAVRRATRIITVSESVMREVVRILGADDSRIHAIHHGASSAYRPAPEEEIRAVRERHGLTRPYLLFVGNLEPRKNLPGLLRAFRLVRERVPDPIDLVVAGKRAWLSKSLLRELEADSVSGSVRTLGYVGTDDLVSLYGGALAFVFPSFWEGFGLPVLEAMACGTPVVTSGLSSLPEVAGDAAVLVDPHSPESIAAGILEVVVDPARREDLRRRGLERARVFGWRETARNTLAVYRAAAARGAP